MLIQKPVLSEKSQKAYQKSKICSFYVAPQANKFQIKKIIEETFRVKVKKVRTSRVKSVRQKVRYSQKTPGRLYTKLQKKALVELMPGQELPIFATQ